MSEKHQTALQNLADSLVWEGEQKSPDYDRMICILQTMQLIAQVHLYGLQSIAHEETD